HILPGGGRATIKEVWLAAELDCQLGRPVDRYARAEAVASAKQRLKGGGFSNGEDGVMDIESTYAALRLDSLVKTGCSPGWWAGVTTDVDNAFLPPHAGRRAT